MDEWWMSFLGDSVFEGLHSVKNRNGRGADDLSHQQSSKLKPVQVANMPSNSREIRLKSNTAQIMQTCHNYATKTSAEIHTDWNSLYNILEEFMYTII